MAIGLTRMAICLPAGSPAVQVRHRREARGAAAAATTAAAPGRGGGQGLLQLVQGALGGTVRHAHDAPQRRSVGRHSGTHGLPWALRLWAMGPHGTHGKRATALPTERMM